MLKMQNIISGLTIIGSPLLFLLPLIVIGPIWAKIVFFIIPEAVRETHLGLLVSIAIIFGGAGATSFYLSMKLIEGGQYLLNLYKSSKQKD